MTKAILEPQFSLGNHACAAGFDHFHLASVGSTNAEALARGQDRLWITADEQTAGRGRRGRSWHSPPGNLYASVLLKDPAPPVEASQLCFVSALAVADAIAEIAPNAGRHLALKWPNDILIDGAKVAGILIEGAHGPTGFQAVIGCGVNVARNPEHMSFSSTRLTASDPHAKATDLFMALSNAFALRLEEWDRGTNFSVLRKDWLMRARGLGERIVARLPQGDIVGMFEDLDDKGALVLRGDEGQCQVISAGEIVLGEME